MSDHWDTYFCLIEDKFASIVLDMDIWREIDQSEYKLPVGVRIPIKNQGESGTPVGEEAEILNALEDQLTAKIGDSGFNVGRLTTNGCREIYYYLNSPYELEKTAYDIFKGNHYDVQVFQINENSPWEFYFDFLYPDNYQIQHMGNRKVVESLMNSGDLLEISRRVDHWLYFPSAILRARFEEKMISLGFEIVLARTDEGEEHLSQIYRNDYVDYNSINEVTDLLVNISEEFEGRYDGWETMVVK
jgi:regulator of RNase E activity RraB